MVSTRERLLDAALASFAANGVDGTAIVELEERAGLSPGSGGFYRYFRTKDEALEAAVRREMDRLRSRPSVETPDLHASVLRSLDTLAGLRRLIAVLARERPRIPDLAREIAVELVDGWVRDDAAMLAAVEAGADGRDDDAATSAVLISALVGYHLASEYFGGPPAGVDRDRFADAIVDLFAG